MWCRPLGGWRNSAGFADWRRRRRRPRATAAKVRVIVETAVLVPGFALPDRATADVESPAGAAARRRDSSTRSGLDALRRRCHSPPRPVSGPDSGTAERGLAMWG